jgi:hypothetical protein
VKVSELVDILQGFAGFLRETSERLEELCRRIEPYQSQELPVEIVREPKATRSPTAVNAESVRQTALELKDLESRCLEGSIPYAEIAAAVKSLMSSKARGMNAAAQIAVARELGIDGVKSGKKAMEAVQERLQRMRSGADDTQAIGKSFQTTTP